ncbi:MAG: secretin N-terminal domain-containing protein [Bacillota bacterium]
MGNRCISIFLKTVPALGLILTLALWSVLPCIVMATGNDTATQLQRNGEPLPAFYIVQWEDTIYSISKKFGIAQAELIRLNDVENNMIYAGQKLLLRDNHTERSTVAESAAYNEPGREEPLPDTVYETVTNNLHSGTVEIQETAVLAEMYSVSVPDAPFVLDVRAADLRDVLTALAIRLKKTIILLDDPVRVTFNLEGTTPLVAMQLLLQKLGYDYVEEDDFILVGRPDRLRIDFYDHMLLSRFNLQYISASNLTALIRQLGLPLQVLSLELNPRTLWAQGTPRELGRVREIIAALDRPENADPETTNPLTRFNMQYLNAETIIPLIEQLAIPVQLITLPANPQALWAQGTPVALERVKELITALDRPENAGLETKLAMARFQLHYIPVSRMKIILQGAGIAAQNIIPDETAQLIWVYGSPQNLEVAQELIAGVDLPENAEIAPHVFFYQLKNISAADAAARLETMDVFNGVKTMTFSYPEISQELLVICPPHLREQVYGALGRLDEARRRIRMPVDSAQGENARNRLAARRELLAQLTGVSISRMHISGNLSGDSSNPYYVLWVEETPDKIQLVRDMIEFIDNPKSGR